MISVNVIYLSNKIDEISIDGHALFDEEGHDIVCAGASISFLGCLKSLSGENISYEYKKGFGKIKIKNELSYHDQVVLEVMINQMQLLSDN